MFMLLCFSIGGDNPEEDRAAMEVAIAQAQFPGAALRLATPTNFKQEMCPPGVYEIRLRGCMMPLSSQIARTASSGELTLELKTRVLSSKM